MDGFTLANGEVVLLLVSAVKIDEEGRRWLDEQRVRALTATWHVDITRVKSPRMSLFGYDNGGNRIVWDLAVRREQEAADTARPIKAS